jgi:hypothetical protein
MGGLCRHWSARWQSWRAPSSPTFRLWYNVVGCVVVVLASWSPTISDPVVAGDPHGENAGEPAIIAPLSLNQKSP